MLATLARRRRTLAVAALLAAPAAPAARAATVDWLPTAPSPAPFSDPANWSTNTPPTSTDAARFGTGSAHIVTLAADATTNQLLVANDNLTLDLAGYNYTLANAGGPSAVVSLGSASTLTLLNSGLAAPATLSTIQFTMSPNPGDVSALALTAGTALAAYNVTNVASANFTFAKAGAATVSLTDGARLDTTANTTTLASDVGSSATVTLAGPTTRWDTYLTDVGVRGDAAVQISNGATMVANTVYLGKDSVTRTASGSITVDGAGSSFQGVPLSGYTYPGRDAYVGYRSRGSLTVRNGGSATAANVYLGYYAGASGSLTVQDPGSTFTASALNVGWGGTGSVLIESGTVTVSNTLKVGNSPGSSLTLAGGTLKAGYLDTSSNLANFHWTGGNLELTSGGLAVIPAGAPYRPPYVMTDAGPSLSLTPSMTLKLSNNTTQYLIVDGGGSLSVTGTSVASNNSVWVGYASSGSLSLSDHASLTTSSEVLLGYVVYTSDPSTKLAGSGTVTLEHYSTLTSAGRLYVGTNGSGTLVIRGGSSVSSAAAFVSYGTLASSATVDGTGSSWTIGGTLTMGMRAQGALTISNGGTVSSAAAFVGNSPLEDPSSVVLSGPGSSWANAGTLYVAYASSSNSHTTAAISLSDHASLSTKSLITASTSTDANATLSLSSNSTLAITSSAYLGGFANIPGGTATLSLTDSLATVGNTLKLHNTPNTSLSLTRSTFTVGSAAAPGSLDNAAAISLADHSVLTLHGTLANAGTITLSPDSLLLWDPGTSPAPLDALRAQLATNHVVTTPSALPNTRLAYVDLSLLPADRAQLVTGGLALDAATLLTTVALTGDANLDGTLDADDYALVDRSFAKAQTNAHWTDGDFDYDGQITSADFLLIDSALASQSPLSPIFLAMRESQFGAEYVAQLLTSIPEPSALVCLLTIPPLTTRRRSHR